MNNDEKWCLKWDEFDSNIREYFRSLRKQGGLFDVTLATEDGHQIQAHKIILSAASNFFSDIFLKSDHTNMLVYLKGIRKDQLETVIDFIYNGEAYITQKELEIFLETGKDLQVKGLQGEIKGVQENISIKKKSNDHHKIEADTFDYTDTDYKDEYNMESEILDNVDTDYKDEYNMESEILDNV